MPQVTVKSTRLLEKPKQKLPSTAPIAPIKKMVLAPVLSLRKPLINCPAAYTIEAVVRIIPNCVLEKPKACWIGSVATERLLLQK